MFGTILLSLFGGNLIAQYKIDPRFKNLIQERKEGKSKKVSTLLNNDEVLPITSLISPEGTVREYYQAIIYTKDSDKLKQDGYIVQSVSNKNQKSTSFSKVLCYFYEICLQIKKNVHKSTMANLQFFKFWHV